MATEVLALDTVVSSSNVTGATVSNLNAQDAAWAVATANNVATSVRAGFPTSTGSLNAGANLQTITVQTRKFSANSGNPTGVINVGVTGGAAVVSSASFNITSTTGQTNTLTFDASAITGITSGGANLEAWIDTTNAAGGPSVRNSADIGYIAWTADYTAAANHAGASVLAGTGTLTAAGRIVRAGASAISGAGTLSVSATVSKAGAAALSGAGAITVLASVTKPGAAILGGTGTITAAGTVGTPELEGSASLSGAGTLGASGAVEKPGQASLVGAGTLLAAGAVTRPAQTALAATGTLSASAVLDIAASVSLAGQSSLTASGNIEGAGGAVHAGATSLAGVSSLAIAAAVTKPGAVSLSGASAFAAAATRETTAASILGGVSGLAAAATVTGPGGPPPVPSARWTEIPTRIPIHPPAHGASPSPPGANRTTVVPKRAA